MKRCAFLPLTLLLCVSLPAVTGCSGVSSDSISSSNVTELIKTDLKVGEGEVATAGKHVAVHYTGWLYDETAPDHRGQKFDSTLSRGKPYEFLLGRGVVIKGWDLGLEGMKVGGQRTLIVPAALAYGPRGFGHVIPPDTALVFYVEVESVH